MAINDVAGEKVYHVWDILREFLVILNYVGEGTNLQEELLKRTIQLRTGQPSILAIQVWYITYYKIIDQAQQLVL